MDHNGFAIVSHVVDDLTCEHHSFDSSVIFLVTCDEPPELITHKWIVAGSMPIYRQLTRLPASFGYGKTMISPTIPNPSCSTH